jgi:hypothetical protein
MSSHKIIIVLLIVALAVSNLFVGAWSFITINSLNLPARISAFSSDIDSLDITLVKTVELQESLSNLKESTIEELTFFTDYSEMLNMIPIYFIAIGALLLILAVITFFIIPDMKEPIKNK